MVSQLFIGCYPMQTQSSISAWSCTVGLLPHLKSNTADECHHPRPGYERVSVSLKEREWGIWECQIRRTLGKTRFWSKIWHEVCLHTKKKHISCTRGMSGVRGASQATEGLLISTWSLFFTFSSEQAASTNFSRGLPLCHLRLKDCPLKCNYAKVSTLNSCGMGKPRPWKKETWSHQLGGIEEATTDASEL